MLLARHTDEDEQRVVLAIADLGRKTNGCQSTEELLEALLCFSFV